MRVGVIQSCYIPWRGYFDFIDSVDLFVIYDDVQYSSGSWRNRNQIKTPTGLQWLTVPVSFHLGDAIDEARIAQSSKQWSSRHRQVFEQYLGSAPHFRDALAVWQEGALCGDEYLSVLNVRLIRAICAYLRISTPIVESRPFALSGARTERLIELLLKVGASAYLSGPTAKGYLDEDLFRQSGLSLEYKNYEYPPYPQLWGPFVGSVTVLDLIANVGPSARQFLKSRAPDEVAVT